MENNKMGTQPIPRLLFTMGAPMILSMVVQAFYNIVDTYFVSNITSDEIANISDYAINAITLAFPVQMLMIAIGVGTGVGVNALLSRYLGQKNYKSANLVAGNAIFTAICTYTVFLLFGLFGEGVYMRSQTSDPLVINMGMSYLSVCTILSFGSIGSMIYEKLLQSTGKTTLSTIAQLCGAVLNIILDPILIYGLIGFPEMGVKGAAVATVTAQILTLVLGIIFHHKFNKEINDSPRFIKPNKKTILGIYRVGLPAIIMQALMSVMSYGINVIFAIVSQAAVTAFGIYYKIQQFVYFAAFGMNNAMIPIIAFNYGRGDKRRMKDGIKYGILYTLILMLLGAAVLRIFALPICGVFSLSSEATELCKNAIRIVTLGYLFAGVNIAMQGTFQALGDGVKSLIVSLIRLIVITLPLAFIFAKTANAEVNIWFCFPLAELCGLAAAVIFACAANIAENGGSKKRV